MNINVNRWLVGIILLALTILYVSSDVYNSFTYSQQIGSYWDLSVKASTLQQKTTYLDQYVDALEKSNLSGSHDAIFLKTPNNSYDQNLVALKSLQARMHEIEGMDVTSFPYQTAMQQITGQEENEADELTSTFEGCWMLNNHWLFMVGSA